jgi:PPOX class probable F420-dependent enzyme
MDLDGAREFIRQSHRAVLATRRRGGSVQLSPVLVNLDGQGRGIISSRETAIKVKNLRRDSYAQLCVFENRWPGRWIALDGEAEVLSLPEAMEPLIDYYKRFPDENPVWDEYRERMRRERRVLIRIELQRAGPDRQG